MEKTTSFTASPDGTQIAYDRTGTGPAIILVHGGGTNRHDWQEAGYVERLQDDYTVITLDLRGHGQSGLPTDPADYTTGKMGADILAVADACGVNRFTLWGMSFGGKVSRYLAVASERVAKIILMGTPMGPGVSGQLRQFTLDFCDHWMPIHNAQLEGRLNPQTLSSEDQAFLKRFNLPVMLAWVQAMLDWPAVEPPDFRCPTLWLVGSEDENAITTLKQYEELIGESFVQVCVLDGLDHNQVFDEVERVFPTMLDFTRE